MQSLFSSISYEVWWQLTEPYSNLLAGYKVSVLSINFLSSFMWDNRTGFGCGNTLTRLLTYSTTPTSFWDDERSAQTSPSYPDTHYPHPFVCYFQTMHVRTKITPWRECNSKKFEIRKLYYHALKLIKIRKRKGMRIKSEK